VTAPIQAKVSFAFGADPAADPSSWSWTAVSDPDPEQDYVRPGVSMSRGRSSEQGSVSPQWCELVVRNPEGKFSPRNPVGPHYGQLRINTPMRVELDPGSGYVTLITALVPAWQPRWAGPGIDEHVPIRADGQIRRLGQ
jgi:hypothetical protein